MLAKTIGAEYDPEAAYSSSSYNVEGGNSMDTGMANLPLNDPQPQIPTHLSPSTFFSRTESDRLKPTDQMGSSNPSTSNLSLGPYNNTAQQAKLLETTGSHSNTNEAEVNFVSTNRKPTVWKQFRERTPPTLTSSSDNSHPSRSTYSPAMFPPSPSDDQNLYYRGLTDLGLDHPIVHSLNEHNRDFTFQGSSNDPTGKNSGTCMFFFFFFSIIVIE